MYIPKCRICKTLIPNIPEGEYRPFCSEACEKIHCQNMIDAEMAHPFVHYCPICNYPRGYKHEKAYTKAKNKGKLCNKCYDKEWIKKAQETRPINDKACHLMDEMNRRGYHFQHGKNGGEIHIYDGPNGYFLDGYDAINQIVFEYDEPSHFQQWEKDRMREHYIFKYFKNQNITIRFIRFCEFSKKFYEVFDDVFNAQGKRILR